MTSNDRHAESAPQWAWFDRWTEDFMRGETYPALWDEMKTDRFKPVIVWWGDSDV